MNSDYFVTTTLLGDNDAKLNKDGTIDYSKDFFKKIVKLTETSLLDIEPFALSLGDVYSFGPTFNANPIINNTLSEMWKVEPEMPYFKKYIIVFVIFVL